MRIQRLGGVIIISGPSGVGKSTLIALVRKVMPDLEFSISCTTRPPRTGEVHGEHYHFLSEEEFERRLEKKEFIEHAGVFARRYGTLRSEVIERVKNGIDVILDIEVQGATQIKNYIKQDDLLAKVTSFIMIAPPSLEELEHRLRTRATDSEEQICMRLEKAVEELAHYQMYDYMVFNKESNYASGELVEIIKTLRLKCSRIEKEVFCG